MVDDILSRKSSTDLLHRGNGREPLYSADDPHVGPVPREQLLRLANLATAGEMVLGVTHDVSNPLSFERVP